MYLTGCSSLFSGWAAVFFLSVFLACTPLNILVLTARHTWDDTSNRVTGRDDYIRQMQSLNDSETNNMLNIVTYIANNMLN